MTHLERLIKAQTETTTIATVSAATEKLAEEMARELLHDPAVRAEIQALVRTYFTTTIQTLRNGSPRRTLTRRKKRATPND